MRKGLAKLIIAYLLHTPPHRGRGIFYRLAQRLFPQQGLIVEPLKGIRIHLRNTGGDFSYLTVHDFARHGEPEVFSNYLQEGMTVLDIGANLGVYALYFARCVGQMGRVFAFEPVPTTFARLKEHIALNNAANIFPVPFALSDREGSMKMWVDEIQHAGSSFYVRSAESELLEVPVTTVDLFVQREGIKRVDAIKIDVEGAELAVIRGADRTLRRDKPLLMVEINEATLTAAGTTPEELFATIVDYGYDAFVIRHGKAVPTASVVRPYGYYPWDTDNYLFVPR